MLCMPLLCTLETLLKYCTCTCTYLLNLLNLVAIRSIYLPVNLIDLYHQRQRMQLRSISDHVSDAPPGARVIIDLPGGLVAAPLACDAARICYRRRPIPRNSIAHPIIRGPDATRLVHQLHHRAVA